MQLPQAIQAPLRVADNVPPHPSQRRRLREVIARYVAERRLSAPLSINELSASADAVLTMAQLDLAYRPYAAVEINNELWRPALAAVPFEKRLLLLPQCLRSSQRCSADIDELGLSCKGCGSCCIDSFASQARRLGYMVMVAEGSALVTSLIASGRIEAVVGVSCLPVLEKVFPYMQSAAVPGVAIPLLCDGCRDTHVDQEQVWDAIYLARDDKGPRMNLESLQNEIAAVFAPPSLRELFSGGDAHTDQLAIDWLARGGKRYRPFLSACVFQSFQPDPSAPLPDDFRRIAVAVECFHKASLVHDDIEDKDELRYGQQTLHRQYGVPIALNVGDLLLGQGYRMISACRAPAAVKADMLAVAASGHCELCAGQGAELWWSARRPPLTVEQTLEIFRRKTAPAFEVALNLGAIYAGAGDEVAHTLSRYSQALGIAYQIRDDLDDFAAATDSDGAAHRPSILLAIAYERSDALGRQLLEAAWRDASADRPADTPARDVLKIARDARAYDVAAAMLEHYKSQAICALGELANEHLKTLLRQVVSRIFLGKNLPEMSCCDEYKARNASGGQPGAATPS